MSKSLPQKLLMGSVVSFMLMTPPNTSDAIEQRKQFVHEPDSNIMQLFSESWRKGTIDAAFLLNKNLDSRQINVAVLNETAILHGAVDSEIKKSLAAEIALSVSGIEKVINQLIVIPKAQPTYKVNDELSPNTKDRQLMVKVQQKLLSNQHLRSAFIEVHTRDGMVELSGKAPDDSLRDLAYYLTKNVPGVKSVDNKIKVRSVI